MGSGLGGSGLGSRHLFEHLRLDPGHGLVAGQLPGDEGLDLDAHLGEHPLVLGADVPCRLVLVQVEGLPGDLVAGSGEVFQTVAEQIVVVGLEIDLAAVFEEGAVLDELAGIGEAVLVGGGILAPRVAEIDVDAVYGILRREDALDALDVGAHDLDVVDGAARLLIGGLDLALGQNEDFVGDVDAEVVVLRVGAGQLGDKAALAAAQFQHKGLLRAGILCVPPATPDQGLVDVEIGGHQLIVGVGFEAHSHNLWFSFKNRSTCSGDAAQLPWQMPGLPPPRPFRAALRALVRARTSPSALARQ